MSVDYTTSYQIKGGVLVYTQWVDHDQTVVGRGGFPLSSVATWNTDRLRWGQYGDEETDSYTVALVDGTKLIFCFPFAQDHGEAWAAFDDHMMMALSGWDEPANGWSGAGITKDTEGGGS